MVGVGGLDGAGGEGGDGDLVVDCAAGAGACEGEGVAWEWHSDVV